MRRLTKPTPAQIQHISSNFVIIHQSGRRYVAAKLLEFNSNSTQFITFYTFKKKCRSVELQRHIG